VCPSPSPTCESLTRSRFSAYGLTPGDREASSLVRAFEIDADLTDAGLWMIARGERSALELYAATPSFRYTRLDLDDEGASGEGAVDGETAVRLAEGWLNQFGAEPDPSLRYRTQGKPILHSVTNHEVLISERERREPRSMIVGTDVNYAFEYDGLPLLGSGAKAKISIHPTSAVSNAYRFARNLDPVGTTTIRSTDELLERFAGSHLFADVTDETARARVDSVRFGWLTLPPTEHMNVLLPAIEVRGSLATEAQTYDFIKYVAAARADEAEEKAKWRLNARPGLLIA